MGSGGSGALWSSGETAAAARVCARRPPTSCSQPGGASGAADMREPASSGRPAPVAAGPPSQSGRSGPGTLLLCGQASRAISTGQLSASRRLHIPPIYVVVFHGPSGAAPKGGAGRSRLEGGFPLRCFQRLSRPNVATRRCRWRDNRNTRGPSAPVLSYWERLFSNLQRPRQIGTELSHDVLNPARVPL